MGRGDEPGNKETDHTATNREGKESRKKDDDRPPLLDNSQKVCNLLKETNSITVELIPASALNLEYKTFDWTLTVIDQSQIAFKFFFDHPEYISQDGSPDTMLIKFENTPFYLLPDDTAKKTLPNGWHLIIKLPPQVVIKNAESIKISKNAENLITKIIEFNGVAAFVFGISMQPLFDMINSLQITALLPLLNIILPEPAMSLYKILVKIVSFDYFDPYDPGFTETEPYSYKFDWFGFGSVNFIDDLGTFLLFLITLLLIESVFAIGIWSCTRAIESFFR